MRNFEQPEESADAGTEPAEAREETPIFSFGLLVDNFRRTLRAFWGPVGAAWLILAVGGVGVLVGAPILGFGGLGVLSSLFGPGTSRGAATLLSLSGTVFGIVAIYAAVFTLQFGLYRPLRHTFFEMPEAPETIGEALAQAWEPFWSILRTNILVGLGLFVIQLIVSTFSTIAGGAIYNLSPTVGSWFTIVMTVGVPLICLYFVSLAPYMAAARNVSADGAIGDAVHAASRQWEVLFSGFAIATAAVYGLGAIQGGLLTLLEPGADKFLMMLMWTFAFQAGLILVGWLYWGAIWMTVDQLSDYRTIDADF